MKKHVILLVILAIFSVGIVGAYYSLYYPTQPRSEAVSADGVKLTIKSERGTYKLDADSAAAPLGLTATLKNENKTELKTLLVDIKLYDENGSEIAGEEADGIFEEIAVAPGKNRKLTDSFDYEYSTGALKPGKYTVSAYAVYEIDGQQKNITSELVIKIK